MHLLDASTVRLASEPFYDEATRPRYAILSHTWGADEVTYQDMHRLATLGKSSQEHARIVKTKGYYKIRKCCEQALRDGFKYAWVDTCCIQKRSSSQLSEAINSMFKWYKNAGICYAYLDDVDSARVKGRDGAGLDKSYLEKARWFTRGWTLQELIAPEQVVFYGKGWTLIDKKTKMVEVLRSITGINRRTLNGVSLERSSIAQRMSWAANRTTSRQEDIAYCLLGIFDINMPLLYGEGEKAFVRLQEDIMKDSDDQSLFAWVPNGVDPSDIKTLRSDFFAKSTPAKNSEKVEWKGRPIEETMAARGAFAQHPSEFRAGRYILPQTTIRIDQPYALTNKGVQIEVPLIVTYSKYHVVVVLSCYDTEYLGELLGMVMEAWWRLGR